MRRRRALSRAVLRAMLAALAVALTLTLPPALLPGVAGQALAGPRPDFAGFLESFWPLAAAKGVSRATFEQAVAGLAPDPAVSGAGPRQSEFLRPMKAYVAEAASPGRVARGRAAAARWAADLRRIEAKTGVPASVILAVWGMETDFGAAAGDKDVLRSLATLAYVRGADSPFADEFAAALLMLERGVVTREKLRGSWAGAMGQPQFMPSAYWLYAVPAEGSGPADIWTSVPDSLASIANFLARSGWKRGESWGAEVGVPPSFAFGAIRAPVAAFAKEGVRLPEDAALGSGEAMLFRPVGAGGPAFLLAPNFFVLKAYNFSDNYAMAVAVLADRIAGREPLRGPWPEEKAPLTTAERVRLQEHLRDAGVYAGVVDGRFGPVTRDAVFAWQRRAGVKPADGYPSRAVLQALDGAASR